MIDKVQRLLEIPKIVQKTPEWYEARHGLITASDFAQALGKGKFGTQRQLIQKKVEPCSDTQSFSNVFFEWGNLFEPVASMIYSKMHEVTVHEFGLLRHPHYDFFGASPDGITDSGVMLEIKCPLKRKITGEIPEQYYYQIQGQLDVCDLDVCDYFECEFAKYNTYKEYLEAYTDGQWTGAFENRECTSCQTSVCEEIQSATAYWILQKHNVKRVERDKQFVTEKLEQLKVVWDKIVHYRSDQASYHLEVKKEISIETTEMNFSKYRITRLED